MRKLNLSLAILRNARANPIVDSEVKVEGVDLNVTVAASGGEIFWRQLHFGDFDIAEMSFSDIVIQASRGHLEWVMIPVFTTRRFFHTNVLVRAAAGIETPADLRGKRVGLQEYVQTANVWTRGVLQEHFGVHPDEIHWHQERSEAMSHCHYFGIKPPPPDFDFVPSDSSVGEMMLEGELDAVLTYPGKPNLMDRSSAKLRGDPRFRPLFPKPRQEQRRYFAETGFFPINHAPVIRRSLVEKHPWLPLNLYQAFLAAKDRALSAVLDHADTLVSFGRLDDTARTALDEDPYPYGIEANRELLETCIRYSRDQGLAARDVALEEIFAEQTMAF